MFLKKLILVPKFQIIIFLKNLKQCNFYLEYGSGNSTILANKLNKKFKSIELDKSFYNYLKSKK